MKNFLKFNLLILLSFFSFTLICYADPVAPTVTTDSVDTISYDSVYWYGTVLNDGGDLNMSEIGFEYGTDTSYSYGGFHIHISLSNLYR